MKASRNIMAISLAGLLSACGDPTVIDMMKDTHIDGCDTATVGEMLISYFPTTNWTAYQDDSDTTFTIYGGGSSCPDGPDGHRNFHGHHGHVAASPLIR